MVVVAVAGVAAAVAAAAMAAVRAAVMAVSMAEAAHSGSTIVSSQQLPQSPLQKSWLTAADYLSSHRIATAPMSACEHRRCGKERAVTRCAYRWGGNGVGGGGGGDSGAWPGDPGPGGGGDGRGGKGGGEDVAARWGR